MSFAKKFAGYFKKGYDNLKKSKKFEFPRRNSTLPFLFVGYTLVASHHAWYSYETILKTGEGKKAYQNPTQMLELATLEEHTTDVSGLLLARDALQGICEIMHSGIASMESRLKAAILLMETSEYNKKIRRYLIESGELERLLDSLETPCNLVVVKVMLLRHLSVEDDAFRMIWSSPKFVNEIFPCLLQSNLNNLRFHQLTKAQQLYQLFPFFVFPLREYTLTPLSALVRMQLAEVREVFRNQISTNTTKQQSNTKNFKSYQVEIPSIFMNEMLPALLTDMALDASKRPGMGMMMAQNNFVDIISTYLINTEPWYSKALNTDGLTDSLVKSRAILKNISMECYKQRGWPEDNALPPVSSTPSLLQQQTNTTENTNTSTNTFPSPSPASTISSAVKSPAQIVADLKDAKLMRRSWVLIFSDRNANTQIVVDGKDEVVRHMIPHVNKMGLRVVPSLDVLEGDALARAEKMLDVPVADWELMQDFLPAKWRRDWYFPSMPSFIDVARVTGPALMGVVYGTARAYFGMRQTYRGSQTMTQLGRKWCLSVALRTGSRTGLAVAFMGMLPDICRWITGHTQQHFETPKSVVASSIVEGVSIVGVGALLLRNCHYWFLPFLAFYMEPKQVIQELVFKIRD